MRFAHPVFLAIFLFGNQFSGFGLPACGADPQPELSADPKADAHVWNQTAKTPFQESLIYTWAFSEPGAPAYRGWVASPECRMTAQAGFLNIEALGHDPYAMCSVTLPESVQQLFPTKLVAKVTLRGTTCGNVRVYWSTRREPGFIEKNSAGTFAILSANEWDTVEIPLEVDSPLDGFRLDPAEMQGTVQIQKIEIYHAQEKVNVVLLPWEDGNTPVAGIWHSEPQISRLQVTNPQDTSATFQVNGESVTFSAGEVRIFTQASDPAKRVDTISWRVQAEGIPPITRTVSLVHDTEITSDWTILRAEGLEYCQAPDQSMAFLCIEGKKVAAIAPLNREKAEIHVEQNALVFTASPDASEPVELPILHIPGEMRYAVLPGVELLEKGEWSSSKLDIQTEAHQRICPVPNLLTQQWMGLVTQDAILRLQWRNPTLQPTFAVPNYFDGTPDARLSLFLKPGEQVRLYVQPATGTTADAMQLNRDGTTEQIAHFTRQASAPDTPVETLFQRYRKTMETDTLFAPGAGWRHCSGTHWGPIPSAGIASSLWLVGGTVPTMKHFSDSGAHIPNDKIYFLQGKAEQKRQRWLALGESLLNGQQPDGRYTYDGVYVHGHFENTALGVCVMPAFSLLECYAATGDSRFLEAGLKTLRYARRFQVARGAQCWEMPLHTPDPLAAGKAVRAYTLAYRLTQAPEFLEDARRWALEGLTYVYWWDAPDKPLQFGATIGVLGATFWKAPLWIGRPVQWIGTVYAYGLLDLSDALQTLAPAESAHWRNVAAKITESAERQVYPEGESQGLLPDSFDIFSEARFPWDINPSALISLRVRLSGQPDGVVFVWNEKHRVVSPFPVELTESGIRFNAPKEISFQILLDNQVHDIPAATTFFPYPQD